MLSLRRLKVSRTCRMYETTMLLSTSDFKEMVYLLEVMKRILSFGRRWAIYIKSIRQGRYQPLIRRGANNLKFPTAIRYYPTHQHFLHSSCYIKQMSKKNVAKKVRQQREISDNWLPGAWGGPPTSFGPDATTASENALRASASCSLPHLTAGSSPIWKSLKIIPSEFAIFWSFTDRPTYCYPSIVSISKN